MRRVFKGFIALIVVSVFATCTALPVAQPLERARVESPQDNLKLVDKAHARALTGRFLGFDLGVPGLAHAPVPVDFGSFKIRYGYDQGSSAKDRGMQQSNPMALADDDMTGSLESTAGLEDSTTEDSPNASPESSTDALSQYDQRYSTPSAYDTNSPPAETEYADFSSYGYNTGDDTGASNPTYSPPPAEYEDTAPSVTSGVITDGTASESIASIPTYSTASALTSDASQSGYTYSVYAPPVPMNDSSYPQPTVSAYAPPPPATDYVNSAQDSYEYDNGVSSSASSYVSPPTSYGSSDASYQAAGSHYPPSPPSGYAPPSVDSEPVDSYILSPYSY